MVKLIYIIKFITFSVFLNSLLSGTKKLAIYWMLGMPDYGLALLDLFSHCGRVVT